MFDYCSNSPICKADINAVLFFCGRVCTKCINSGLSHPLTGVKKMRKTTKTPLDLAVQAVGTKSELARTLGVTPGAVNNWFARQVVPASRVRDIERATGVSAATLRPDLFDK